MCGGSQDPVTDSIMSDYLRTLRRLLLRESPRTTNTADSVIAIKKHVSVFTLTNWSPSGHLHRSISSVVY